MIVYLHGFNSAFDPKSDKILELEKYDDVLDISYNSLSSYQSIIDSIVSKIKKHNSDDIKFIGTSLGGFYAAHLGKYFDTGSVIINPAINPYNLLRGMSGNNIVNFVTKREDNFSHSSLESYKGKELNKTHFTIKPLAILAMGDEFIDSHESLEILKKSGIPTLTFPGGNHRFSDMPKALPSIINYFENL